MLRKHTKRNAVLATCQSQGGLALKYTLLHRLFYSKLDHRLLNEHHVRICLFWNCLGLSASCFSFKDPLSVMCVFVSCLCFPSCVITWFCSPVSLCFPSPPQLCLDWPCVYLSSCFLGSFLCLEGNRVPVWFLVDPVALNKGLLLLNYRLSALGSSLRCSTLTHHAVLKTTLNDRLRAKTH